MNPNQIEIIRSNWKEVSKISETAAQLFYQKLFELDPGLKPLFKGNMEEQGKKLMQTLAAAIGGLDNFEGLKPILLDLGSRHIHYGVKKEDYGTVGEALLWTLEKGLGEAFTPEAKEAWTDMYTAVAETMITTYSKSDEPITPEQKALVQSTWKSVVPIADTAADIFYNKLFELDPNLKPLFKGDLAEQKKKLMQTLGVAVSSLDHLDDLIPILQDLGKRHVAYGVEDKHYGTVGEALLYTLETGLAGAYTPEVAKAWEAVYTVVSSVMIEAASEVSGESEGLTEKDIELVQSSWNSVVPIKDTAADLFYDRLFDIAPELKPLFKGDMAEQKNKLMQTLGVMVSTLKDLDSLVPVLKDLGAKHVAYGVEDIHYGKVGKALLWTLEKGLGSYFTPETKTAWTKVYTVASSVMQEGAKSVDSAPAEKMGLFGKIKKMFA